MKELHPANLALSAALTNGQHHFFRLLWPFAAPANRGRPNVGLVDFDCSAHRNLARIDHRFTDAVTHIPRSFVRLDAKVGLKLDDGHTLFRIHDESYGHEP